MAQARVWNLPAKNPVFREICSDERLLAILRPILGSDLMLGPLPPTCSIQVRRPRSHMSIVRIGTCMPGTAGPKRSMLAIFLPWSRLSR